MPATLVANTLQVGQGIVAYFAALKNPDGSPVYKLAQLEGVKDVTDLIAGGGVCCEVYGNTDDSERRGFGGRIWDHQEWFVLSLCSLDTPLLAQQIYTVRDLAYVPLQTHALLGGGIYNLFHAQIKRNSGKFWRVMRNQQWLRAHVFELETKCEWQVISPPGVIS